MSNFGGPSSYNPMLNLKPPQQVPVAGGKRQSTFKNSGQSNKGSERPPTVSRPQPKDSKNYGSFLQGLGATNDTSSTRPPLRGRSENRILDSKKPEGLIRDRSSQNRQDVEQDSASNIDVMSVVSRRGVSLADRMSPNKRSNIMQEDQASNSPSQNYF
jgi:hypothetical protein